ncbi:MAG TPA: hypothetical protein VNP36_20635 [Burkholderiales bacterium]|nr:hypothetical protein [Burkholderiales bacterium]
MLLIAALAGCGGEIVTSPDALSIEPFRVKELRAPQSVALNNALTSPVKHQIKTPDITWEVDARQLTDTAIVMLRRALERQGIKAAPQAGKSVAFRVEVRGGMGMFVPAPTVVASARLTLHADLGDGTTTRVDGEGGSAFGMQGAFEGAIQNALHRLLIDPAFLVYMNR